MLRSDLRGDQSPVLAAVGPLQFEVVEERMANEFNSPDPALPARLPGGPADRRRRRRGAGAASAAAEVLQRSDGTYLALFADKWRANTAAREYPDVLLEELPAGGS